MSCLHLIKQYDDKAHSWKKFPCGHCPGCIADKTTTWSLRCAYETLTPYGNSFLTLTYDDFNVPISLPFRNNFSDLSGSEFYKTYVHGHIEGNMYKRFTLNINFLNIFLALPLTLNILLAVSMAINSDVLIFMLLSLVLTFESSSLFFINFGIKDRLNLFRFLTAVLAIFVSIFPNKMNLLRTCLLKVISSHPLSLLLKA